MPSEAVSGSTCGNRPVFASGHSRDPFHRESAAFDSLCGHYVAETRAKRALVILSQLAKGQKGSPGK